MTRIKAVQLSLFVQRMTLTSAVCVCVCMYFGRVCIPHCSVKAATEETGENQDPEVRGDLKDPNHLFPPRSLMAKPERVPDFCET